ncbi:hypothetical protein [Brevibacillus choshinensis]|uniref:hypothetical protein n=1 Tax=Brevibacillus choshinensis TaxID=54911 RepID=UPI000B279172|nr:hypothetical protein [Brevibacillus choshinensis]
MRMYALLKESVDTVRKVMVYESENGVYVFLYDTQEDKSGFAEVAGYDPAASFTLWLDS